MGKIPFLPVDEVRRIVVFRARVLGDMLCAVPALRAGFAGAEITLVGLPWAHVLVPRLACVDRFVAFPGHPGLPESRARLEALPDFLATLQAPRFDLALQMHGSGGIVNPLVAAFGARRTAAFHRPGAYCPDPPMGVPWPEQGHEIERCLALTDHLGLPRDGTQLELPVTPAEREAAAVLAGPTPYAVVHPGARSHARRWPAGRFARVADALAAEHLQVLVTGNEDEVALADEVISHMKLGARNVAGLTTLWELGALVDRAQLVVCHDSGVSHVAAAMRTPSVVIAGASDVSRWAPLDAARHRMLRHPAPAGRAGAVETTADEAIETALELLESPWPDKDLATAGGTSATSTTTH